MRKNQNLAIRSLVMVSMLTGSMVSATAQNLPTVQPTDSTANQANTKEVKNRNVMLGAGDPTTPRTLNIGLPFTGDILINENDIPVVYTFWTQIPTTCWRYDSSLGNMGVLSFAEGALQYGKVGYIVTSFDREPGRKLRAYANIKGSTEGNFAVDMNITAPLANGWGISLSMNDTRNKGPFRDYGFTNYQDRYDGFKAGIHKKYKNGKVNLLYKYAYAQPVTGSYSPYLYKGDGETEPFPGFNPGRSSYIIGNGVFPYTDFFTGQRKTATMGTEDASGNTSHALYLYGDHAFKGNYKLKYSAMYQHSKVALTMQYPYALYQSPLESFTAGFGISPDYASYMSWYKQGTSEVYDGPVQMVAPQYYEPVRINQFMAKAELSKKFGLHNLRLGTTYMHYHAPIINSVGVYAQTVGDKPTLLSMSPNATPEACGLGGTGSYSKQNTNKIALYVSDDFTLNRIISGGIGARIEHQSGTNTSFAYPNHNMIETTTTTTYDPVTYEPTTTTTTTDYGQYPLYENKVNGKLNYVLTANVLAKLTKPFGLVGEITYNKFYEPYSDYKLSEKNPTTGAPISNLARRDQSYDNYQGVLNLGGGVYLNIGSYLNLVSKITYITKSNIVTSENIYGASGQYTCYPILYDISTIGWTTDVMSTIGNFNLHFLFTLQNPKYKNYDYKGPDGTAYSYSDKNVTALSKTLIEIDPSYYLFDRKVRVWGSARYFGKQYGNKTNTVSYNGWWETFAGIDWSVNRNLDLKVQMCNVLNYKGVTGSMIGADQITNESQMIGNYFVAEQIRPRAIEFSAAFKF